MKKKLLSLLLALTVCVSLLPLGVLASEEPAESEEPAGEAAEPAEPAPAGEPIEEPVEPETSAEEEPAETEAPAPEPEEIMETEASAETEQTAAEEAAGASNTKSSVALMENSESAAIPDDALEYNGHYYYVFNNDSSDWDAAVAYCQQQGGYMATITSQAENEAVYNYIVSCGYRSAYFGLVREDESAWNWVTGEAVDYLNWHSGEPNNENRSEFCAMFYYKYEDGTWNDGNFGGSTVNGGTAFICEWGKFEKAKEGNDTLGDTWSFSNSSRYFGRVSDGYYITSADYERLLSSDRLSAVDKACFGQYFVQINPKKYVGKSTYNIDGKSKLYDTWGGSCYGMSVWTCLNAAGTRAASDIDGTTSSLHDYSCSADAVSAINYYHEQQRMTAMELARNEFMCYAQVTQLEILEQLATEASNGGNPVLIRFQWYKTINNDGSCDESSGVAHAVVGYGIETGNYTEFVRSYMGNRILDAEFTHKVLIYDCSYPDGGDAYCLYYSDGGVWCIPGWKVISTSSQSMTSMYNNGCFKLATSSADLMNTIDYRTGEVSSLAAASETAPTTLAWGISENPRFSVAWGSYSADIQGMSVSGNTGGQQINVAVEENITTEGNIADTSATAFLPDADSYTVMTGENVAFRLNSGNYLTTAAADAPGAVTFQADGGASVFTDVAGAYYIGVTANDGYTELPWNTLEIVGENAQEISAVLTDEGLTVTGDNLDNVTVYGYNIDGAANPEGEEITFSTEHENILISADGDDSMTVLADTDDDGTYETPVEVQKNQSGAVLKGDVNGDGAVNAKDVTVLFQYVNKQRDALPSPEAANVNGDNDINAKDVTRLFQFANKQIDSL